MRRVDVLIVVGRAGRLAVRAAAGRSRPERRCWSIASTSLDAGGAHHRHFRAPLARRFLAAAGLPRSAHSPGHALLARARRTLVLESPHDEFRIGHMGRALRAAAQGLPGGRRRVAAVDRLLRLRARLDGGSLVRLDVGGQSRRLRCRYLIGADGADSRVARDLGLSVNRHWIVGLEEVYRRRADAAVRRNCTAFSIAASRRATSPGSPKTATACTSASAAIATSFSPRRPSMRFAPRSASIVDLRAAQPGRAPRRANSGRRSAAATWPTRAGLLIGDAAGAVSPLTAGGLDPCLRLSELAAKVMHRYLSSRRRLAPGGLRRAPLPPPVSGAPRAAGRVCPGRTQPAAGSLLRACCALPLGRASGRARLLWPRLVSRRADRRQPQAARQPARPRFSSLRPRIRRLSR